MNGTLPMVSTSVVATEPKAAAWGPLVFYAGAVTYAWCLFLNYRVLSVYWYYLGFIYVPRAMTTVIMMAFAAGLPALLLPQKPGSLAQLSAWFLYFTVFIPGMMIPPLQTYLLGSDVTAIFLLILLSAIGLILSARWRGTAIELPVIGSGFFWSTLLIIYLGLNFWVLQTFGGSLSFAGLDDIYSQRASAGSVTAGSYVGYALGNLAGAINPFLIAVGIARRRWVLLILGVFSQVLVFSTLAGKIVLVSTVLLVGLFLIFTEDGRIRGSRILWAYVLVGLVGVLLVQNRIATGSVAVALTDIVYMRTLYLPGVLIGAYGGFFSMFPTTYFSHSVVGAAFTTYPYGGLSVGQVIGNYVTPSATYAYNNYNAGFVAADGIASLGLVGIPLIVAIVAVLLHAIDRIAGTVERRVLLAASLPFVMSLADASLFTSLLTGGGGLLLALLAGWAASERRG